MPLSKTKDRERKRQSRLDKRLSTLYQSGAVQPKPTIHSAKTIVDIKDYAWVDADGNPVYEGGIT